MSADTDKAPFLFVIDTDTYSGNFERPLCGYITGRYGDCEVGKSEAELFMEESCDSVDLDVVVEPYNNVGYMADEHGTQRPVTIFPTPGRWNDGSGGHFDIVPGEDHGTMWPAYESVAICFETKPTDDQIKSMKARSQDFCKMYASQQMQRYNQKVNITIKGFRLLQQELTLKVTEIQI